MEPESSLPHSQAPATCPYLEPDQSSPCPHPNLLKIHFNIILQSTPGSSKWSLYLRIPHQNPAYASLLPHTRYMPRPSHFSRFDHLNNIGEQYRSLSSSLCSFLHSPVTSSLLGPNSLRSSFNVSDQVWNPHKITGKIIVLYILMFVYLFIYLILKTPLPNSASDRHFISPTVVTSHALGTTAGWICCCMQWGVLQVCICANLAA